MTMTWPPFRCNTCGEEYRFMVDLRWHKAQTGHPACGVEDDPKVKR